MFVFRTGSGANFLDRLAEDEKSRPSSGRALSGRRGRGGSARVGPGGRRGDKKTPKSEAELDAELDAYMNKGRGAAEMEA